VAAGREFQAAGPQTAKLRVSPDHNVSTNVDMSERSSPIPEYRDLSVNVVRHGGDACRLAYIVYVVALDCMILRHTGGGVRWRWV